MFINDLEFIESGKELPVSSFAVEGGVSASASVSAYSNGSDSVSVTANSTASGYYSRTRSTLDARLVNVKGTPYGYDGYTFGIASGYSAGIAVDPNGNYAVAYDIDTALI